MSDALTPALAVAFDGGQLPSDGGLVWLARADTQLGLSAAFARQIRDWRRGPVRHPLAVLVRQRILQIACGYEDQDDADTLRHDPLLKLVCARLPEQGADLASQPTLSRLENAVDRRSCYRLAQALVAIYLHDRERDGVPDHVLLDLDGTDSSLHCSDSALGFVSRFTHSDPSGRRSLRLQQPIHREDDQKTQHRKPETKETTLIEDHEEGPETGIPHLLKRFPRGRYSLLHDAKDAS